MTEPSPGPGQQQQQGKAKGPAVKVLDVVEFTRHDPITGTDHTDVGVVLDVDEAGGPLVVRPLAGHHHTDVDPGAVTVLRAGDVGS